MRRIAGLSEIAADFDAMIIDQFGVIHDGRKLYPGAAEVLSRLHDLAIPVVIVTNSGKRAVANVARLVQLGVPRAQFVDCISSGEVAFQSLTQSQAVKTAFVIGRRGEEYGFDPVRFVADPQDAEVMLILGSNAPETTLEDYRRMFAKLSLPCLCCNPDRLMLTAQGLQPAPGAIAAIYEDMGGAVTWIGKPYRGIYDAALKLLKNPRRVLCVGDSAEHDVAGGRNAGLATLLVQQGVSAGVVESDLHRLPDYLGKDFAW